jgi:hypothetical protein
LAVALGCSFSFAGCDLNGLVDITDTLLDPDAALLDHPGRQLAEGHYSGLKIAGSAEAGGFVLARRHDAEDARVAVVPFLLGTPCEYSPAFAYDRFSSRVNIELPGTISVQVDQSPDNPSLGTVRFIDHECHEVIDEVPNTILPGPLFPGVDPIGMLARSADGTLYLVDAQERTTTIIAGDVDYGVVAGSLLFTLENGEAVIRDELLDEVDRVGSGVTAIVATGGSDLTLAYADASGVHAWNERDGASSLAEDGCQPWYTGVDSIAYHAPCESRRLALRVPAEMTGNYEGGLVTLRGPDNANLQSIKVAPGLSTTVESLLEVTIITTSDSATQSGDLVALSMPKSSEPDSREIELTASLLETGVTFVPNSALYFRDYAEGRGTLLDFTHDVDGLISGVLSVATEVAWVPYAAPYSYRGVLADYDGTLGRLLRLSRNQDDSIDTEVLGEDIPLQNFIGDYEREMIGYVSNLDDHGTGVLTIVDELGPYHLANRVVMNEVRLLDDPRGLVFLRRTLSEETFELHTWLVEADLDLVIHEEASEYIPIPWPSPGILYSVPKGRDAGLWFAKAR